MTVHPFSPALIKQIRRASAGFDRIAVGHGDGLKRAAVGIVVVDMDDGSGEAGFLLTLRATTLRAHGGQYALPGGRVDAGETSIETVIRECREEIGLAFSNDDVLGVLDDYSTRSGYAITPVLLAAGVGQTIVANPEEVAAVYRIALRDITRDGAVRLSRDPESDRPIVQLNLVDEVRDDYDIIYAPTAAILFQFAELLVGRTTRVAAFDQPVFARR